MGKKLLNDELNKRAAHLLVVEDDEVSRMTLCLFLENKGYQVSSVGNGRQAVEFVSQQVPDIILMDASMPEMDGFEATAIIRQRLGLEDTPILMITAYDDESYVDRAFEAGATEFISKPIHWAVLNKRLNYLWQSLQKGEMARLAALVLESTNQGMIVTDLNMKILVLNSAFSSITGYSEEEALGKTPRLLQSGRHDKEFYQAMWRSLNTKGQWIGEIWNRRKNGEIYPEWLNISAVKSQAGHVTHYVGAFSDISVLKEKEARLQQLAHFDGLTGLANRLLFSDRFEQAIVQAKRSRQRVAFLYMDLDDFKPVNDMYGHSVGDHVLELVSQRIKSLIRDVDTAGRLGGDEFGIILREIKNIADAAIVADKLIKSIAEPIVANDIEILIGCSIGISVYPDHGLEMGGLTKLADSAMYESKDLGKNRYNFCRPVE